MLDTDPITNLIADVFHKLPRTARYDRDALARAGCADPVEHRPGGRRQWTSRGVANFLILECAGRPIRDAAATIPAIREMKFDGNQKVTENIDVFGDLTCLRAYTFGEYVENLIDDHRAGRFEKWRSPGAPELNASLTFDERPNALPTVRASLLSHKAGAAVILLFGDGGGRVKRNEFFGFRQLVSTIMPGAESAVFERIAKILGPLEMASEEETAMQPAE
jgi:hypothetical protein